MRNGVTLPSRLLFPQLHTVLRRVILPYRTELFEPMANLFELPRYIAIEGPIRVGKSTLARIRAER